MKKTLSALVVAAAAISGTLGMTASANAAGHPITIYQPRYSTLASCQAHPIHVTGAACKLVRGTPDGEIVTGYYWVVD